MSYKIGSSGTLMYSLYVKRKQKSINFYKANRENEDFKANFIYFVGFIYFTFSRLQFFYVRSDKIR